MAQFFDFERNWDEFYSIWSQHDIQESVLSDLQESGVLDLKQNVGGWLPGQTLWQLSPGRYVTDVVDRLLLRDDWFVADAVEARPEELAEVYARSRRALLDDGGTLHAYILPEAAACLSTKLLAIARRMFPTDTWYRVQGNNYSTVISLRRSACGALIFDPWLYQVDQYGEVSGFDSARVLAAVCGAVTGSCFTFGKSLQAWTNLSVRVWRHRPQSRDAVCLKRNPLRMRRK
jgi:hypothetical protein